MSITFVRAGTNASNSFSYDATGVGAMVVYITVGNPGGLVSPIYGGVSLTLVDSTSINGAPFWSYVLFNPPTGTNTFDTQYTHDNTSQIVILGYSSGASVDCHNTTSQTSGPSLACSVTTIKDNVLVTGVCYTNGTLTSVTNLTSRASVSNLKQAGDANGVTHPPGTVTFTGNQSSGSLLLLMQVGIAELTIGGFFPNIDQPYPYKYEIVTE